MNSDVNTTESGQTNANTKDSLGLRFRSFLGFDSYKDLVSYHLCNKKPNQCILWLNELKSESLLIKRFVSEINRLDPNYKLEIKFIDCKSNNTTYSENTKLMGYYNPIRGICVCDNLIHRKCELETAILHNLVHVYDDKKFEMDWTDPKQYIRAIVLSGDCSLKNELSRGKLGLYKHFQKCVKRRTKLATDSYIVTKNKPQYEKEHIINSVFDKCVFDYRPLNDIDY